jgi:hypothetical protein
MNSNKENGEGRGLRAALPSSLFIYDALKKRLMEFKSTNDTIYVTCGGETFIIKLREYGLTPTWKWEIIRGANLIKGEGLECCQFDSLEKIIRIIGDFCETKE